MQHAWFLSVHRTQSISLRTFRADLSKTFDSGQAYTIMSRATCYEGMLVEGFDPDRVNREVDQDALRWER